VLKRDYKVRFPDRRAITLWNTPEISQFRGVQEAQDEMAQRKHNTQLEQMELHRAANRSETSMPDMEFVAAEVMRSRQSEGALRARASAHAQQMRSMQEETVAQMTRLATEATAASQRSELAERALDGLRDLHAENRSVRNSGESQVPYGPLPYQDSVVLELESKSQEPKMDHDCK
jgi:hypothetical protein